MFAPGDEVVCVDDVGTDPTIPHLPKRGVHYTVRDIHPEGDALWLCELRNSIGPCRDARTGLIEIAEPAFFARRFRPVKRETIEIFRAMCTSTKPLVNVD